MMERRLQAAALAALALAAAFSTLAPGWGLAANAVQRSNLKGPAVKGPADTVPSPHSVQSRSGPLKQAKTSIVEFQTAPFPYRGTPPGSVTPFLNVEQQGRRGHSTPFGRVYWEDETYSDRHVLLHLPKGFDARRPSIMIVYFHGHGATLERDVLNRQEVAAQIANSGVNAVLVAPQLAVDAADSSAGKFWEPGAFGRFVGEAAEQLAKLHGDRRSVRTFASIPVVIVAYSGGYLPAAWCATQGGLKKRLRGVVLLDALYGELDKFAAWIENDRSAFFVSAYLDSTREKNAELAQILTARNVGFSTELEKKLGRGNVVIVAGGGEEVKHRDLVTRAWVDRPLADLLKRLTGFLR
jgi:hypothetical protein